MKNGSPADPDGPVVILVPAIPGEGLGRDPGVLLTATNEKNRNEIMTEVEVASVIIRYSIVIIKNT